MSNGSEIGKIARNFLRANSVGVLATHSLDLVGYPFGSVTPYLVDKDGLPIIFISSLAQHTRNIEANNKVSLTIFDLKAQDVQESARLTWIGEATSLKENIEETRQSYVRYFPNSKTHLELSDFKFYQINLTRARFIGGFGKIAWIEPKDILLENALHRVETDILEHMNQDHLNTMKDYCQGLKNITVSEIKMIGIDTEGFDLLADGTRLRFTFEKPIVTAEDARAALVLMARKARAYLPTMLLEKSQEKLQKD